MKNLIITCISKQVGLEQKYMKLELLLCIQVKLLFPFMLIQNSENKCSGKGRALSQRTASTESTAGRKYAVVVDNTAEMSGKTGSESEINKSNKGTKK